MGKKKINWLLPISIAGAIGFFLVNRANAMYTFSGRTSTESISTQEQWRREWQQILSDRAKEDIKILMQSGYYRARRSSDTEITFTQLYPLPDGKAAYVDIFIYDMGTGKLRILILDDSTKYEISIMQESLKNLDKNTATQIILKNLVK